MAVLLLLAMTVCGDPVDEYHFVQAPRTVVHPIVGVWVQDKEQGTQYVPREVNDQNEETNHSSGMALEFTADGKLLMHITTGGKTDTREATYSVSGNQLTMVGSSGTFTINGDQLTLVQGGISISYTRKK